MEVVLNLSSGSPTSNYYTKKNSSNKEETIFEKIYNNIKSNAAIVSEKIDKMDIIFENVTYSVSLGFRKGLKTILRDVNGKFSSGQLVAIIGPSGAGKTTLLDILSGYQFSGIEGTVYANGIVRDIRSFKKSSCYITYNNHLQPLLTVWENMTIAADLKLGRDIPREHKDVIIREILITLCLDAELNTRAACLSGGQQKRLSIALELINNPLVMFLDEPTTGLDSLSCGQCLKLLKRLAKQGRTIVCTIHQPSASLIELFDQVYVLAEGKCLYQGTPSNLIPFLNYVHLPCPKYHNPVDYVIELASGENKNVYISNMTEEIKNGRNVQWLADLKSLDELRNSKAIQERNESQIKTCKYDRASSYEQFKILTRRAFLNYQRDMKLTYMRLIVNIFIGLLCGTVYWQSGNHGGKVHSNHSLLFFVVVHHMLSTIMISILTFPSEMSRLTKEYFNSWYSLKAYFASATISDVPILIICCLIFTAIVYPMTGQPLEFQRVSMFITISILIILVVQSFGIIIGSSFNVMNGTFIGFAISTTMTLLAGIGEDLKGLPVNIHWLAYISYMKYGFEGIVGSIYGFNRQPIYCPEDHYCHYKYPKKFLNDLGISGDSFWTNVLGLCCIFIILRFSAFFVLKWKLNNSR